MAAPKSSSYRGWFNDAENSNLDLYVGYGAASDPAEIMQVSTTAVTITGTATSGLTVTAGGVTATAGGVTATAGEITATANDFRATVGNYRAGPVNAFGTTEPTQAIVLEAGTAPAGAITTSSGIFSSSTVLRKIIANGTVSDVG